MYIRVYVFMTMNCTGFMVIMFVFLLYYYFSSFLLSIYIYFIILCLPFVANKRVHCRHHTYSPADRLARRRAAFPPFLVYLNTL